MAPPIAATRDAPSRIVRTTSARLAPAFVWVTWAVMTLIALGCIARYGRNPVEAKYLQPVWDAAYKYKIFPSPLVAADYCWNGR